MHKIRVLCASLLAFALVHCIFDERRAGTSTSVTNPVGMVTGFAILQDGAPAAFARVRVRVPAIRVEDGMPAALTVSDTLADSAGMFTVPLVFMKDAYIQIDEDPAQRPGRPADSLEVNLRRWPNGLSLDGKMGTFRLQAAGDVSGHIETPDTSSGYRRWIGVRGTDKFVEAPAKDPFLIKGVPEGHRELVIVTVPDTLLHPGKVPLVADSVVQGEVKSRRNTDFGPIFYTND